MKCKVLIDCLKEFNPDQEIILFDENGRPMQIEKVVIDSSNNGNLSMAIDKEKLIEACRCGHEGCVGDICPFYDEDCPAYICKNELLYAVYRAIKTDND